MTRTVMLTLGATVALGAVVGCSKVFPQMDVGPYSGPAGNSAAAKETARAGMLPSPYIEFPYEGRIYVVGSTASMNKVLSGGELGTTVTKIAAGPNRETVVIEADKAFIEEDLISQFNKKYNKSLTM